MRDVYRAMTTVERFLFWLSILNFVVFAAIAVSLGGDALNGTLRDGHYFLMEHGTYTEVGRPVFIDSTLHTLSLFITQPTGIVVAMIARFRAQERD